MKVKREIKRVFSSFGTVTDIRFTLDRTGSFDGTFSVELASGADDAIRSLNGTRRGGRMLNVNEARPREPKSG